MVEAAALWRIASMRDAFSIFDRAVSASDISDPLRGFVADEKDEKDEKDEEGCLKREKERKKR